MRFAAFPSRRRTARRALLSATAALAAATGLLAGTTATASAMTHSMAVVGAPVQSAKETTVPNHLNYTAPGATHGDNKLTGPAAPAGDDPVSTFMDPFMAHLEAAHFHRGVGGQVEDISEFDRWVGNHTALFRRMLDFEVGSGSVAGTTQVGRTFLQHMDAAHWNRSPMGQLSDIVNFDSWNKAHLAMFRMMFDDVVGKDSTLGRAPGTGVFMQHMDAAHWNQSLNEQGAAITDDFSNWMAAHMAMFQAMGSSFSSGGPGGH
jgi:hypothetical protein